MNGKCNWMRMSLNSSTRSPISTIASKHSKPEKPEMLQVWNVWRSFHQLPGDVLALHSAQAISGQTRQNFVHFPEGDRVPKAMQNFLRKFNFATKKRQNPCVLGILGAGGLGQSADDFLCPDFTRCKFQMIDNDSWLSYTDSYHMNQYDTIRILIR